MWRLSVTAGVLLLSIVQARANTVEVRGTTAPIEITTIAGPFD
jgi:hypothetical protein